MKKWIFLIALFTSSYALLAWGHPSNYSHPHDRVHSPHHQRRTQRDLRRENRQLRQQLDNVINNYYRINNHPHHDHGHHYPACPQYGCQTPCNHTLHTCPLIAVNVTLPVIPNWFVMNIQAARFNSCRYQYQWCLWSNYNPYNPYFAPQYCTNTVYYNCMGYYPRYYSY